ncbi:MAG: hypothetical protein AMXMBFR84_22790 [Candidatus Hydrogenedentota bacterium]
MPKTISPVAKWGTFLDTELHGRSVQPVRLALVPVTAIALTGWIALLNGIVFGIIGPIFTLVALAMGVVFAKWRGLPRILLREESMTINIWNRPQEIVFKDVEVLWYRYDSIRIEMTDKRVFTIPQRLLTLAERIELVYTLRIALDGRFMGYF